MEQLAEQMDSQFSERKGRYLMYHGGKEGRVFQADGKAGKKARSVLFWCTWSLAISFWQTWESVSTAFCERAKGL